MTSDDHGSVNSAVLQAIEPYIDAIADRIAARMQAGRERMINQHESELGPRRHRQAVKRRLANGEGGAGQAGRNYLLSRDAIAEELAGKGGRRKGAPVAVGVEGSAAKSRTRELSDFEREVMGGLRAVKDNGR
jgi:hypothetical protein